MSIPIHHEPHKKQKPKSSTSASIVAFLFIVVPIALVGLSIAALLIIGIWSTIGRMLGWSS